MRSTRLIIMIFLTGTYFVAELVSGYITKSNALIADSFHMLSDLLALVVALSAITVAKRSSNHNTFGWIRAETMGALINSVFLMALCFTIFINAINRMFATEQMKDIKLLLIVGAIGLVVNLIGMALFSEHGHHHHTHDNDQKHKQSKKFSGDFVNKDIGLIPSSPSRMARYPERALNDIIIELQHSEVENENDIVIPNSSVGDGPTAAAIYKDTDVTSNTHDNIVNTKVKRARNLNIKGVFLHVLADALGSVVVIISGLIIMYTPKNPPNPNNGNSTEGTDKEWLVYIDPTLSLILVIIIIASTLPLFKESAHILLQNVPSHMNANDLQKELLRDVPEIDEVHDFHLWQLSNDKIIGSAHVKRSNLSNYMSVADNMKKFFHNHGVHSTTIQIEHVPDDTDPENADINCLLSCPTNDGCIDQTCCGRFKRSATITDSTNGTATIRQIQQ
ncbi:hypothetical protein GJ496_009471 [Pomphorhynchus laevis]|nr:hypothetical protein GJ496_009471 [Pomphorhynchus laevis]